MIETREVQRPLPPDVAIEPGLRAGLLRVERIDEAAAEAVCVCRCGTRLRVTIRRLRRGVYLGCSDCSRRM